MFSLNPFENPFDTTQKLVPPLSFSWKKKLERMQIILSLN